MRLLAAVALASLVAGCASEGRLSSASRAEPAPAGYPKDCFTIYSGTGGLHATDVVCPGIERTLRLGTARQGAEMRCASQVAIKPNREGLHADDYECAPPSR